MNKKISLLAVLTLFAIQAFSHALWIKTAPAGKTGQAQTVTVIYSEPDDSPEKIADWYSDVKEFELWLTAPDGKKEKLTLTAGEDRYTATFTPDKEGIYILSAGKTAKDLGGTTVYQFNASAFVAVGKAALNNEAAKSNELALFTDVVTKQKVNKPVKLQTYYNGQPAREKMYVSVSSPSGWSRNVMTDENGVAEFTPLWPGSYALEVSKSWKQEGEHNGKAYTGFWRCATLSLDVSK